MPLFAGGGETVGTLKGRRRTDETERSRSLKGSREGRVLRTRGSPKVPQSAPKCVPRRPRLAAARPARWRGPVLPTRPSSASRTASCLLLTVRRQVNYVAGERPVSEQNQQNQQMQTGSCYLCTRCTGAGHVTSPQEAKQSSEQSREEVKSSSPAVFITAMYSVCAALARYTRYCALQSDIWAASNNNQSH